MKTNKDVMTRALVACLPKKQAKLAPIDSSNVKNAPVRLRVTLGVEIHSLVDALQEWFVHNEDKVQPEKSAPLKEVTNGSS
jgi:hypothetical protein